MRPLILLALALLPQQEPADRTSIRELLVRLSGESCGEGMAERNKIVARLGDAALQELPALIKESEGDRRRSLLGLYGVLADRKDIPQTPAIIVNLARSGSGFDNLAAARIALRIRDERAFAFLVQGLKRVAADDATETGALESLLLDRAGWSHCTEAGVVLLEMLNHPNMTRRLSVIDALGNLGYAPALEPLKKLSAEKYPIPGRARAAIEKIEILGSPDRAARLLDKVRGLMMSGEYSWYRWALEQIAYFNLTEAAGSLREIYDAVKRKFGAPEDGMQWGAALLSAIHKLGGNLSPEETALLQELGNLPPAPKSSGPEEELIKGFEKSVWAPQAQRTKEAEARRRKAEARNAPPPRISEEKLPRIMKDRIRFVMKLQPPDPAYLAPHALLALGEIEEMLGTERDPVERDTLLEAYLYLSRLRDGMKTPDVILGLAREGRHTARRIVTTIADERAEAWFLDEMKGPNAHHIVTMSGRLTGPKVQEALLKFFRGSDRPPISVARALVDAGCVEVLPELRTIKGNPIEIRFEIEKLEILAAADRDAKLLAAVKSMRMSGEFSWFQWGLDQILRLDLKHLAPDLRKWYDAANLKWAPSHDPHRLIYKMPWVLSKLGAPITPEEEELLKRGGRRP